MNLKKKLCFAFTFSMLVLGIITPLLNTSALIGDNFKTNQIPEEPTSKLNAVENYNMYFYPYAEYDAYTNGYALGLTGDDVSAELVLPFSFTFYDTAYTSIYIGSNGWLSFTVTSPVAYINPSFPVASYTNVIAPFWTDLFAQNNVYILEAPNFVVIEYHDIIYYDGVLAGTFSVFLSNTGEIVFLYDYIYWDEGATIGLNYGFDTTYYTRFLGDLTGVTTYALLFTTATVDYHDLDVGIFAPTIHPQGFTNFVDAYVWNIGTYDETNVEFYLYLDDVLVNSVIIPTLQSMNSYYISYALSGLSEGDYNFTAYASPVTGELTPTNNYEESWCSVVDSTIYGFIVVNVYDGATMAPIDSVDINLLDDAWNVLDSVTTTGGFYNFTDLDVGGYHLDFFEPGYYPKTESFTVDVPGDANYLDVYLFPIPPRSITILTPSGSQTVEGGSVLVSFTASDSGNLDTIDIWVNLEYIATTYYEGVNELIVPVFQNGSNYIELYADWGDGSDANDGVTIDSVDVIPSIPIQPGDFFHMKGELMASPETVEYNFTFVEWISPFIMNVTGHYRLYDDTGTLDSFEDWFALNVLNGFIPYDSGAMFGWVTTRILIASCLPCPVTTGTYPIIGDKSIFGLWNSIHNITGDTTWKNTDVWVLEDIHNSIMYVEKSTQLILYYYFSGIAEFELLNTSIDFTDPILSSPADLEFVTGSSGNIITWLATDLNPHIYTIYVNGVETNTSRWYSDKGIEIIVDDLPVGLYEFKIILSDAGGNSVEDIVIVNVIQVITEINEFSTLLLMSFFIFVTYTLVISRKRKPSKN